MSANGQGVQTGTRKSDQFELTTTERTGERHVSSDVSAKQQEIQGRIIVAKKFPRNEDESFAGLMKAAGRPSFADDAGYSFPRGDKQVEGPSVNLAREAARVWGNISYGLEILRDDEDTRHIRGWAWDMQTNAYTSAEDDFKTVIQRKVKDSKPPRTEWIKADERELRELTNRRGAILVRNCLLQLLPKDMIELAFSKCKDTLADKAAKDPDGTRKAMISDFADLNVTPTMLEAKLGHPLTQCTPAELAELRRIYKSIADGNSSWSEYAAKAEATGPIPAGQSDADMERIQKEMKEKSETKAPPAETKTAARETAKSATAPAQDARANMKEIPKEEWDELIRLIQDDPNLRGIKEEVKASMKIKTLTLIGPGQHEFLRRMRAMATEKGYGAEIKRIVG